MSALGSATRQVNVYGRKGTTRVIPARVEEEEEAPPPAPKPAKGLFAGLDLRSWIESPRKVLAQFTPKRASGAPPSSEQDTPEAPESPLSSKKEAPASPSRAGGSTHALESTPAPAIHSVVAEAAPADDALDAQTEALANLSLGDDAVKRILRATQQDDPEVFTEFLDQVLASGTLVKIGEASYSEVYRVTRPGIQSAKGRAPVSVMKVIPLEGDTLVRGPAQSPLDSVEREIRVTRALSPSSENGMQFVRLQEARIVRGAYPSALLHAWDDFKAHDPRSENARPDILPDTQLYAVLCMDDAGTELEHTPLSSWAQRAAVFWQTAYAIAAAEQSAEFEHRDLHLGNILVTQVPARRATRSVSGQNALGDLPERLWHTYEPRAAQIRATIIDYSLSRMIVDGRVLAYDFSDEELFEGQGDSQYDVYRTMRALVASDWQAFQPSTNLLWLHFLAQRLLAAEAPPTEKAEEAAYTSLLLAEQLAEDAVEHLRRIAPQRSVSTRSKRRSIQRGPDAWKVRPNAATRTVASAADLVRATVESMEV